ncbi:MAG: CoA-binding protein [Planctomycetota bacterium]|jgi:predicted CoA-binding protein
MHDSEQIARFLDGTAFAVIGASKDRAKFGNLVLRAYQAAGRAVHVVHPREAEIEGVACVARVEDLPDGIHGVSLITPPAVTVGVLPAIAGLGISRVWLQPGAESDEALELADDLGLDCIAGGPCLLVEIDRSGPAD